MIRPLQRVRRAARLLGGLITLMGAAACAPERADFDTAVWRLDPEGAPVERFGDRGRLILRVSEGDERTWAAALAADGALTLAGAAREADGGVATVVRLTPVGVPDSTLAGSGVLRLDPARAREARALALQDSGLLVGGWTQPHPGAFGAFVARFRHDGSPDSRFGSGGYAVLPPDRFEDVADLQTGPDGAVWVVGERGDSAYALRLDASGAPDPSFGQAGSVTLPWRFGSGQGPRAVTVLQGGGALVAGAGEEGWVVARLTAAGALDQSFGEGGVATVDWKQLNQRLGDLLMRPDGRILLVGDTDAGLALASLLPDGAPDATFGRNGRAAFALAEYGTRGVGALLLSEGEILVLAEHVSHKGSRPFLVTVAPDGRTYRPASPAAQAELRSDGPLDFVHGRAILAAADGGFVVVGQM